MTPLIDVMLVRLIILIITIPSQTHVLQACIRREAGRFPQPEIHIRVDKFAKYQIVAQTLADLQRQGLTQIGFVNNENF